MWPLDNDGVNRSMTAGMLGLAIAFVVIWILAIATVFIVDGGQIPDCREDEVIAYEEYQDNNTLFCLHIDEVASSVIEAPQ